jgi:hypothetical protein
LRNLGREGSKRKEKRVRRERERERRERKRGKRERERERGERARRKGRPVILRRRCCRTCLVCSFHARVVACKYIHGHLVRSKQARKKEDDEGRRELCTLAFCRRSLPTSLPT